MSETLTTTGSGDLSPAEAAYFDTRGEAAPDAPAPASQESAAEPEAAAGEPGAEGGKKPRDPNAMVPHGALHEERERRKAIEAEARQLREEKARFEGRLQALQQLMQPKPAEQQEPVPDFATDPQRFIEGSLAALRQQQEQIARDLQQRQAAEAQQRTTADLVRWGQDQENAFKATRPDYSDSVQFLRNQRFAELKALGVPEADIPAIAGRDLLAVAAQARLQGRNFAEIVYATALARGYTAKQAAAAEAAATEKLDTVARGQSLGNGLGSAGSAPETRMTAQRLVEMSEADFGEYLAKHPREAARLMGG